MEDSGQHFLVRLKDILIKMEDARCLVAKFTSSKDGLVVFDTDKLVTELMLPSKDELVKNLQTYFCWSSLPGNVVQCSSAVGGGGYYWKLDGFSRCAGNEFLENVKIRQLIEEIPRRKRKLLTPKPKRDGKQKCYKKKTDKNVLVLSVSDVNEERFLQYKSVSSSLQNVMGEQSLHSRSSIIIDELNEFPNQNMDTLLLKAVLFFITEINKHRQILKISSSFKTEWDQYRVSFITDYAGSFLEYTISQMKKYKETLDTYLLEGSEKMNPGIGFFFSDTVSKEVTIQQFLIHHIPLIPSLESNTSALNKQKIFEREKTSSSNKIGNVNTRFERPDLPYLDYDETFLQHLQRNESGSTTGCEKSPCSASPLCAEYSSKFAKWFRKSLVCRTMQSSGHCNSEKCCVWLLHVFQEHSFSCVSEHCSIPGCNVRKTLHQKKCFHTASCNYKCCTLEAKRKIKNIFLAEEEEEEEEEV